MDEGRRIHDEIETFIEYNQKLPDYLSFDFPLVKPQPEAKIVTHYNDRWDLSGVIDNLCQDCFMEFKTGSTPATSYTRRRQIPFYFLLLELDDNPKDKAFLVKYNQHEPSNEIILVWKTQSALDDVRNYIDTLAPEIEDFFRQKSIITWHGL